MRRPDRLTPPAVTGFGELKMPGCRSVELDNGITLVVIPTGESPANRLSLIWNYGTADGNGLYYPAMVVPMMMQGAGGMSALEIVDSIDFLGAFVNNRTHSTYTGIDAVSLNEFTPRLLDILTDVITDPTFPVDRFEAMRRQTLAKFEIDRTHPRFIAQEKLTELLAGVSHKYVRPTTTQSLTDFTVDDIRRAKDTGIGHSPLYITVAGHIDDALIGRIETFAHSIRPERIVPRYTDPEKYRPEPAGRFDIRHEGTRQVSIAIGIPTIGRDDSDYIPLRMAVTALGGYFGSRLMTNIREKRGLTYGISACLAGSHEGATIKISAECNADAANLVMDEIRAEILLLATRPMPSDELGRLKSYYMTTIADTVESFITIGEYYENRQVIGTPDDYFERQQSQLRNLTADRIAEMTARYIIPDEARTVVVS